MNVIVSNRQKDIIDNANIDAIKDLRGLFNVDDLINKFKNYVFSKMILDATSVVNFASKEVLEKLVDEIGADRLIILLPSNPEPPTEFVKLLIDLKIYNFTTDINDVIKFIDKPNEYEDAIKTIDNSFNNNMYVDNSIKENEEKEPEEIDDYKEDEEISYEEDKFEHGNDNGSNFQNRSLGDILNNFNLNDVDENNKESEDDNEVDTNLVDASVPPMSYDDNNKIEEEIPDNAPLSNTFLISDSLDPINSYEKPSVKKVIGFKNITIHAGSTSLIYMLHKTAINTLKKDVLSVEINKDDFKFYRDSKMISISSDKIKDIINDTRAELILVDLNECEDTSFCDEIIYLVEPSTIKLNKLMIENKNIFRELADKKVVLNKSLLSESDIKTLSSEAGMRFFDNIKPLNDRILNDSIDKLLGLLDI